MVAAYIALGLTYLAIAYLVGCFVVTPIVEWLADKYWHATLRAYEFNQLLRDHHEEELEAI